jgi:hypothetical protein
VILSVAAAAWGFIVHDATVILRVPVLFLASFLVFEVENSMEFGKMAFFASSIGCILTAIVTMGVFKASSSSSSTSATSARLTSASLTEPTMLVDITLLWGVAIAFLDGADGVTKGGLAFAMVLLLLPGLHLRGYPLMLALTPLVIPLSFLYFLSCLVEANIIESGDTRPEFIGAIAGGSVSLLLLILSLAQIAPVSARGASDFSAMRMTITVQSYHDFLFWASLSWMYVWVIIGLYLTEMSVALSLICAISIGILNLVLGLQRDGLLLRMSGLLELCVAIWLGATAPGVQGFAQAVLVLVGSFFALGSAGMYFYWMKTEGPQRTDELRPTVSVPQIQQALNPAGVQDGIGAADGTALVPAPQPTPEPEPEPEPEPGQEGEGAGGLNSTLSSDGEGQQPLLQANGAGGAVAVAEKVSHLSTIDAGLLASSELGLSGGSETLLNALMEASGLRREQFSITQVQTLSGRLAAAARSLLRETAQAAQLYSVTAERLKVRAAASDDASILRMVGRGAVVSVISSYNDPMTKGGHGQEWFELGIADALGGDQLVSGGGWVLAGTGGRVNHLSPYSPSSDSRREKSE